MDRPDTTACAGHRPGTLLAAIAATAAVMVALLTAQAPAQVAEPDPESGPRNVEAPSVSRAGTTLTTTNGTWVGARSDGYSYAWLRCADADPSTCNVVPGRTTHRYAISSDDAGKVVRSRVTASNRVGSADADSEAFGPLPANEPLPPPPPPPDGDASDARRLNPFPVVVVAGRVGPRMTRVTGFVVRGPRRALVRVRCGGSSRVCPLRSSRSRIPASRRLRVPGVQNAYRPGAVLDVRVTAPDKVGKFTRITFRSDRTPRRVERCLAPGDDTPVPCR